MAGGEYVREDSREERISALMEQLDRVVKRLSFELDDLWEDL